MIRLNGSDGYFILKDTETQRHLGKCEVDLYDDKIEIWGVRVYEEFQRKGYATIMLKRIIKKYKNDKIPLLLYVHKENIIAIHLYEKLGFEIVGKYLIGDAWTMQYKGK